MKLIFRTLLAGGQKFATEDSVIKFDKFTLNFPDEVGMHYLFAHSVFSYTVAMGVTDFHGARDSWSSLQGSGVSANTPIMAVFYRAETGGEDVLFINQSCSYEGDLPHAVLEGDIANSSPMHIMTEQLPVEIVNLGAISAKIALIKGLSTLDSLSELEKQVDLLTLLVIQLASKAGPKDTPPWFASFAAAVTPGLSTARNGEAYCIEEVGAHKQAIRDLQATYFARTTSK